jgi:hypothetical protein
MSTTAKKQYPTALPHRAPEDLAARCDLWRRRTIGVIVLTITILAIAAPAVVYWRNEARAGKNAMSERPNEDAAPGETPLEALPPRALAKPNPMAPAESISASPSKKIVAAPLPKEVVKKPALLVGPSKTDSAVSQKVVFLEALGSLSAAHLFQSYLNIGLLADGVESEAYTPKQAEDTLLSINEMMDQAEAQLARLTKVGLDAEDNAALEQIRAVTELLRLQSKYLKDYWRTGDTDQAKQYHEVRQAAWKGLTRILQMDAK